MTDHLPRVVQNKNVENIKFSSESLIWRGLKVLKSSNLKDSKKELDTLYKKVRGKYDEITEYGRGRIVSNFYSNGDGDSYLQDARLKPLCDIVREMKYILSEFEKLADEGYGKSYWPLSNMYLGRQGVVENLEKSLFYKKLSLSWLFSNKELEDAEIWRDLGNLFFKDEEYEQASYWCHKAADAGDPDASYLLGLLYAIREGDTEKEMFWYGKAKEQNHLHWAVQTSDMKDNANIQNDIELYFRRFKEGKRDIGFACCLGDFFFESENYEKAAAWYLTGAMQGDERAAMLLTDIFELEEGPDFDDDQIFFWYHQIAIQAVEPMCLGDSNAIYYVASMYEEGRGVKQDCRQAAFWYLKCANWYLKLAKNGDYLAQSSLAELYFHGRGVDQNYNSAMFWYLKAAENNVSYAQYSLGWMYEYGLGVTINLDKAVYWYRKAAENNDINAKDQLKNLGLI